jgi:hypothetical protein
MRIGGIKAQLSQTAGICVDQFVRFCPCVLVIAPHKREPILVITGVMRVFANWVSEIGPNAHGASLNT